jgi:PAS domain S-box-containing protein
MRFEPRISLGVAIPVFLLAVAFTLVAYSTASEIRHTTEEVEQGSLARVTQTMTLLQGVLDSLFRKGDIEGVRAAIADLGSDPDARVAVILDDHDQVAVSSDSRLLQRAAVEAIPQFDADAAGQTRVTNRGGVRVTPDRSRVVGYYPVTISEWRQGRLFYGPGVFVVQRDLRGPIAEERYQIQTRLVVTALGFLGVFMLLGVGLRIAVTRRVTRLVEAAQRVAGGDLSARAILGGRDELAAIAGAFNVMVATMAVHASELREREAWLRAVMEQAGDELELFDLDGRVIDVNSAACAALGYSRDELCRLTVADIDPDWDQERFRQVARTRQPGQAITVETTHRRRDGSSFPVEVRSTVIDAGGILRVLSLSRDLTERRRGEEDRQRLQVQLAQAQKMESVGRLSGGVAHDFNNMLAVILGHTEMALDRVQPTDPIHADLAEIQAAARRSADLTGQLLAFARKQPMAPRVLDLNERVAATLKMLERLVGEDVRLEWRPGEGLHRVRIDPSQLDQLLTNLCVNARDAITGVGTIAITTANAVLDAESVRGRPGAVPGTYASLGVRDTGCGMSADQIERVFEPFFTTKQMGRGTGLGLATVYGIVKQNAGFIEVVSSPGAGAAFTIYLPRAEGEADPAVDAAPSHLPRGSGETILIVEDEAAILALGRTMLSQLGYTVLPCGSPGEALRVVRDYEGDIDLLLTDVVMPEMNGHDLAMRVAEMKPHVKRLYMSGYTANVIVSSGGLDADVDLLKKPFSMQQLATKVREVLARGPADSASNPPE